MRQEHRRKKVGSMLLKRVYALAEEEKCKRLRLQVLDWNKVAISFYKKHGGTITGEWLNCDFEVEEPLPDAGVNLSVNSPLPLTV